MVKEKFVTVSDYLWRVLLPVFLAVVSLVLQSAASELRELREAINVLKYDIQTISVDIARLKTRLDYHEKVQQ